MNTNVPQIARPTPAANAPTQPNATASSISAQSKPAFVSSPIAAPAANKAAQAPAAKKPAAKKAKKAAAKKAAPAVKKATAAVKKAAAAAKPIIAKQQAAFSNASSKQSAAAAEVVGNLTSKAAEGLNQAIANSKQNIQVAIECGNTATSISKSIAAEFNKIASQAIAQNSQALQKFLACRTASDLVNLGNTLLRSHADSAYNSSLKLAELTAQFSKISEPLNAHLASATQSLNKKFSK